MFFVASKLLWFVFEPSNVLVLLVVGAALATFRRRDRARRIVLSIACLVAFAAFSPLGALLSAILEDRFPPLSSSLPAPDGIVVLGGSVDENLGEARGRPTIGLAADRVTEGVALALRFPAARLVFTGGSGALLDSAATEAAAMVAIWTSLGISRSRIEVEDRSRNTYENAVFTRDLVHPKPGEHWLLVTSAAHMPRAIGIFDALGWPMRADPVDYTTFGTWHDWLPPHSAAGGLARLDGAVREWIGLVAYRLTGRTAAIFPAPSPSSVAAASASESN